MTEPTLATINEFNQRIIELSSGLVPLHEKADIYFEDDESNHEMTALLNAFNSFNRESLSVQALALFEEMVNSVKKFDNFWTKNFKIIKNTIRPLSSKFRILKVCCLNNIQIQKL